MFVKDDAGRTVLEKLAALGVRLLALRCTGFFEDLSGEVLQDDVLARLLTFPNVLITAHQAFLTREALKDIARVTVENVRCLAAGQPFLEERLL